MKKLIVIFFFTFPCPMSADTFTHQKAAENLINIIVSEQSINQIINNNITNQLNIALQRQPKMRRHRNILLQFFQKYMGWESIKKDLIIIYTKEFTEQELNDISIFYSTLIGKKIRITQNKLAREIAYIQTHRLKENFPELKSMIDAESKR